MKKDRKLKAYMEAEKWEPDKLRVTWGREELAEAVRQKQIAYHPSLWNLIRLQFRYMEKRYCLAQIAGFGAVVVWLRSLQWREMDAFLYLGVIASLTALLGVGGMLGLGRLFAGHMAELEQTCYFNLGQMVSVRMILYGLMDLAFLNVLIWCAVEQTQMQWGIVVVYLITDFLVSNVCYFVIFTRIRGRGQTAALVSTALLLMAASTVPAVNPENFLRELSVGWAAAAFGAVAALVFEVRYVFLEMTKGEMLCQN